MHCTVFQCASMWNGPENHDKDEQRGICELNRRNTKKRIKMSKRSVSPKITKVDIKYQHQFSLST